MTDSVAPVRAVDGLERCAVCRETVRVTSCEKSNATILYQCELTVLESTVYVTSVCTVPVNIRVGEWGDDATHEWGSHKCTQRNGTAHVATCPSHTISER